MVIKAITDLCFCYSGSRRAKW